MRKWMILLAVVLMLLAGCGKEPGCGRTEQ